MPVTSFSVLTARDRVDAPWPPRTPQAPRVYRPSRYAVVSPDEFGYHVVRDKVHVHDFQATILHLLGLDHEKLTYRFQGHNFRLTDVHGEVVRGILA